MPTANDSAPYKSARKVSTMRGLVRYVGWGIVGIHVLTGALFAVVTVIIFRALLPGHWPLALAVVPLLAWSWWSFYAEARYVIRVSRAVRR